MDTMMLLPVSSTPERKGDIPFHFDQGLNHMQQGDPYRAMGHILEVLRRDSTHTEALNALGVICWKLYKSGHSFGQMAIEYLSQCIARDPENRQAVLNLVTMWCDIYQSHKAKILCESWLKRHPFDNEIIDFSNRISRAPSIFNAEKLRLHGKAFEPDPITDQFGVYVGSTKYKLAYLVLNKCACSTFRNLILSLDYQGDGGPLNNMITRYDNDFSLYGHCRSRTNENGISSKCY